MTYPNQNRPINAILILLPFVILFAIGYYKSANSVVKPYQVFRDKSYNHNPLHQHQPKTQSNLVSTAQIHLQKDKKIIINKTCLVFKGISHGVINMELYLLELDPEVSYLLSFSKESLQEGVWVDNAQYRLVSVKKNTLRLTIENSY